MAEASSKSTKYRRIVDMLIIKQWEEKSYYLVEASFSKYNPIHKYVFYTGFLSNGFPAGYNLFVTHEDAMHYEQALYIKPLKKIASKEEFDYGDKIELPGDRIKTECWCNNCLAKIQEALKNGSNT